MNRSFLMIAVVILSLISPLVFAGSLEVDRVWQSEDFGYALVTYTNDTGKTFKNAVTIKCVAYDQGGKRVGVNTRSFFCFETGPIIPGFQDTLQIPIALHGATFHHVKCKAIER